MGASSKPGALGFVLIRTTPTKEFAVYKKLDSMPEVKDRHALFGEYDLIIKVQTNDETELGTFVVNKIRAIDGILDTKTLITTKF
ncbi:MAG: Lrp/AsnC ligand binding domain-containing protein [Candidatus Thermoplasmatota archaeon]|nr:Lrp/AsnC ligand binding domain-containing protein [Candidatus Thermoplasmatota archaeon]